MAQFAPFVWDNSEDKKVPVKIVKMSKEDAKSTNAVPLWQSDWTSDYITNPKYQKYAMKSRQGELIALGAYEILHSSIIVHIVYLESHPESNPTIVKTNRKYSGIGRAMIAFGIKLSIDNDFGGDVTFEAKTPELAEHYIHDFGAIPLPAFGKDEAPRFILSGEAVKNIFMTYLE